MAENPPRLVARTSNLVEGLLDIQGQYLALAGLYEKQNSYAQKLVGILTALQRGIDVTIPLNPEILSEKCTAAFLVSEGVVVMYDLQRQLTSKPLQSFPTGVILSVVEESTKELSRLMSEKRRTEGERVESLEKVLKELEKAQTHFHQAKEPESCPKAEMSSAPPADPPSPEGVRPADSERSGTAPAVGPFFFKGSFGEGNGSGGNPN